MPVFAALDIFYEVQWFSCLADVVIAYAQTRASKGFAPIASAAASTRFSHYDTVVVGAGSLDHQVT